MKNIIFIVAGLLLISSFATIGLGKEASNLQTMLNLTFSDLKIKDSDDGQYLELNFNGAKGVIYQSGAPNLPEYSNKMTFPFGTKITGIECKTGEVKSILLDKKIAPAPYPVPVGMTIKSQNSITIDETIYNSDEFYPSSWFSYYTGGGLDENMDHKTFLVVQGYPVRYNSELNMINYVENMDLTISYQLPDTNPFPSTQSTQMVIIAPEKFKTALDKLVTHKINFCGISTILKTTEEIYSAYSGVDKPEQIKYYIKDAIESMDIKYVLLVGGLNSYIYGNPKDTRNYGSEDYYLPVRYTNVKETQGDTRDPGYISDLYFADIYDSAGNFSSWDSNRDNIFAKWDNTPGRDVIDFYPDVCVGRLACANTQEVKIMVNKIINYEKGTYGSSWANKIIVIGADSFDDTGTNYVEGEVVAEKVLKEYMSEYTPVKIYGSYKTSNPSYTPQATNIIREISKGSGFLFFDGHGNPASWNSHYPRTFDSWIGGIQVNKFPLFSNGDKLPICCIEACHSSQFNISAIYCLMDRDNKDSSWTYGYPIPQCWSWWMTRKVGGGSVATIGNTGLGYGAVGEHGDLDKDNITEPDCTEALGGFWFLMFYESVDEGVQYLGEAWAGAATKYLNKFPGMKSQSDAKEVQELLLLGDPSLKIGGYPTINGLAAEIVDSGAGVVGSPQQKLTFKANAYNTDGTVSFMWDLNEDGIYNDATGETITWSWKAPGVHTVSLKIQDASGTTDTYDTIVEIETSIKTILRSKLTAYPILQQILGL